MIIQINIFVMDTTKVKIYSNDIGRLVMEQNDIMLSICMIVKK